MQRQIQPVRPGGAQATFIARPIGSACTASVTRAGSAGSKVIAPDASTPVETVTMHAPGRD